MEVFWKLELFSQGAEERPFYEETREAGECVRFECKVQRVQKMLRGYKTVQVEMEVDLQLTCMEMKIQVGIGPDGLEVFKVTEEDGDKKQGQSHSVSKEKLVTQLFDARDSAQSTFYFHRLNN